MFGKIKNSFNRVKQDITFLRNRTFEWITFLRNENNMLKERILLLELEIEKLKGGKYE
tara:strand:- start:1575 stop:1748 length:174 start_codon:yes stop_codon:yes gene_type:complete